MRRYLVKTLLLFSLLLLACSKPTQVKIEDNWVTATAKANDTGLPIVLKLRGHLPPRPEMANLPSRMTISWAYDGQNNNGMPTPETRKQMNTLEDLLEIEIEKKGVCEMGVTRTGNSLKEFIYFVRSEEQMKAKLKKLSTRLSKYPISISYKHDSEWRAVAQILETMILDEDKLKRKEYGL